MSPEIKRAPRPHENGVEALRGLAALLVLYTHGLSPNPELDPSYSPSGWFWAYLQTGWGAVLLFFVISGYVIGLTNQAAYSPGRAKNYLLRRVVRILPLYVLAIGLSELSRPGDSWGAILGNLAFLQNPLPYFGWTVPLLKSNTNFWSLNYEVLYYLAFLVVWRRRWHPLAIVGGCAIVATAGFFVPGFPGFIACYAAGGIFWFIGLWLSRQTQTAPGAARPEPWPSLLLLVVITWKLMPTYHLLIRLDIPMPSYWVGFLNFEFVPVILVSMAVASRRRFPGFEALKAFCLLLPVGYLAWWLLRGKYSANPDFHPMLFLTVAAALLWKFRPPLKFLERLAWIGTISYGLYIFQRPVQWFVRDWLPLPQGSGASFSLRLVLVVGLSFLVAYLGERVLQPQIARWARRKWETPAT